MKLAHKNGSKPKAVILTAIPVEYSAVREHLLDIIELPPHKGKVYEKGIFNGLYHDWEVGIAMIGVGNNISAMETERAINFFEPDVMIFVGVAGGIKDVKLGDVIAVDKAYGYEHGKVGKAFYTRPEVGKSTYSILERAKAEARKDDWKKRIKNDLKKNKPSVFVSPIAAGEKVIAEIRSEVYKLLKSNYNDSLGVEMEGSGFYVACHANENVHSLIIRGISDLIKNKDTSDKSGYQVIASKNASAFAFEVLSKFKIK